MGGIAAVGLVAALGAPGTVLADEDAGASALRVAPGDRPNEAPRTGTYIVQVEGEPLATYEGGIEGLQSTAPADGDTVDVTTPAARAYRAHLADKRSAVLDTLSDVERVYDYDVVLNGFAAKLSSDEAAELAKNPGVVHVWKNEVHELDTVSTPDFLGLSGDDGVWQRQYGGAEHAGEGVIAGVIDSGVWPESESFADLPEPRPDQDVIDEKWNGDAHPDGSCWSGEEPQTEDNVECNNKVIGARYFTAGYDPDAADVLSPRDMDGHGTHVGATVAGNHGVSADVHGSRVGEASGMAPQARLAFYKTCWAQTEEELGGCNTIDSVAAIDQAVADGVDVLNYSISGSQESVVDPVELAFLNAAYAGVFVAASAGNAGPGSTVAHNSPWLTTVAASTHDRSYAKSVTLGNGETFEGLGVGDAVPEAPLTLSTEVPAEDAEEDGAHYCAPGSLDDAEGQIVVCSRGGEIALVDKSLEVADAGGVGMILHNEEPGAATATHHLVPTVHVEVDVAGEIRAYAAEQGATAELSEGEEFTAQAPEVTDFSSGGPALAGEGDLLKPDLTAPGSDVVAAVSPPANNGTAFDAYSGTSMSSPHVAGLGALLRSANPDWSPMWIKSALMTTAGTTDNQGEPIQRAGTDATPFDLGAGHVDPARAFSPGLVFDSRLDDWAAYACAIEQAPLVEAFGDCADWPQIDASDLNGPSIAVGALAGSQTVTRTVTNTSDRHSAVYTPRVDAPEGLKIDASPSRLVVPPSGQATVELEITRADAELDDYAFGELLLDDVRGSDVSVPIVAQPVALSAPSQVVESGASGSTELDLQAGYDGTLEAAAGGLVPAEVEEIQLRDSGPQFDLDTPDEGPRTAALDLTVAEDGVSRVATFDDDYADGTDLDLFVYQRGEEGLQLWDYSAQPTSEESVTVDEPGDYVAYVSLFAGAADGGGAEDGGTETALPHAWEVDGAEGNLEVDPKTQDVGNAQQATVTASWSDLEDDTRYLGVLTFSEGDTWRGQTVLAVSG